MKAADEQCKIKQDLIDKLKDLGENYNGLVSKINKNVEKLQSYMKDQEFQEELSKRNQISKSDSLDVIEEEDQGPDDESQEIESGKPRSGGSKKGKENANKKSNLGKGKKNKDSRDSGMDRDPFGSEISIPDEIKNLIDNPDDIKEPDFKESESLTPIFQDLEEKNLFIIQ